MTVFDLRDAKKNVSKPDRSVWFKQLRAEFDRFLSSFMKKHTELNEKKNIELWNSRSRRSIAE